MKSTIRFSCLLLLVFAQIACGSSSPSDHDAGLDAGADAGSDAGADAGSDAGLDAGLDGGDVEPMPREARGVWVTRWNWSDAADIERIVDELAGAGFNQIYFQVRGAGDAYYDSTVEPWASRLSGTLGVNPGWDPLQVALEAAHGEGLELHAWINTIPAWSCSASNPVSSGIAHVLEAHPEWSAVDDSGTPMLGNCSEGYVSLSPGIPEVRAHIRAVAEDLLGAYDIDGLHLDYIRYPGPEYSHDLVSEAAYAEALQTEPDLLWGDWQRRQINKVVAEVHQAVRQIRPEAVLSSAVWFIRENVWGWSSVSQGYHDYYQDPWAWTAAGTMDAIVPMIYFPLTETPGDRLDFAAMMADHIDNNPTRFVYAGIEGNYDDFAEIAAEVQTARELGAAGFVIFAYPYIEDHAYWEDFALGPCAEEALPPIPTWY